MCIYPLQCVNIIILPPLMLRTHKVFTHNQFGACQHNCATMVHSTSPSMLVRSDMHFVRIPFCQQKHTIT